MVSNSQNDISMRALEVAVLAAQVESFLKSGGKIESMPEKERVPEPPRKDWIDPETVLKRKRYVFDGIGRGGRMKLRLMADSL